MLIIPPRGSFPNAPVRRPCDDSLARYTHGVFSGGRACFPARNHRKCVHAGVAQLVEHHVANVVVVGSNPITRSARYFCQDGSAALCHLAAAVIPGAVRQELNGR